MDAEDSITVTIDGKEYTIYAEEINRTPELKAIFELYKKVQEDIKERQYQLAVLIHSERSIKNNIIHEGRVYVAKKNSLNLPNSEDSVDNNAVEG